MAERLYSNTMGRQNVDSAFFYRGFSKVVQFTYANEGQNYVGSEIYGADDLGTDGLHHEVFIRTRLQGQAAIMPVDKVRQRFPMATYKTASILVQGYDQVGISYEDFPEDQEDFLPHASFVSDLGSDLSLLQLDTIEDLDLRLYAEGEARLGGFARTPLFVDGIAHRLQLVGRPDYFSGQAASNIIESGGISEAMFALAKQFGWNNVSEEGRPAPLNIVGVMGRRQNIELVREYVTSPTSLESFQAGRRNPHADLSGIKLIGTDRLPNDNDLIFFYEGWAEDIKRREKYHMRSDAWIEGNAQFTRRYSQIRSRIGYYFYNNRRVLLMRGAA